jgi:hypothetical protein
MNLVVDTVKRCSTLNHSHDRNLDGGLATGIKMLIGLSRTFGLSQQKQEAVLKLKTNIDIIFYVIIRLVVTVAAIVAFT